MNHVIGAGTQLLIGHILTKFGFIFSTHSSDSNQIPNNTVHWFFILLSSSFNIYYSKFFTLYLHYEITVFEFQKFGECIKCTQIGFQICGLFTQKNFSETKFHADKQRTSVWLHLAVTYSYRLLKQFSTVCGLLPKKCI